ncbi:hypothetical protein CHARACLAT_019220 [Characodon lateralis]|uniref:Uncharacterized protein n=1 Tax=Characodon lateralis TaxID=208331 RepID=A0ABU7CPH4_9TELE|nr:hypothetical protein [Characodon lateralis]
MRTVPHYPLLFLTTLSTDPLSVILGNKSNFLFHSGPSASDRVNSTISNIANRKKKANIKRLSDVLSGSRKREVVMNYTDGLEQAQYAQTQHVAEPRGAHESSKETIRLYRQTGGS